VNKGKGKMAKKATVQNRVDSIYHDLLGEASRAYRAFKISKGVHTDDASRLEIHSDQVKSVLLVFARNVDQILKMETQTIDPAGNPVGDKGDGNG
jgi:hypothetical protein